MMNVLMGGPTVFVPDLAARWQASMRKEPNNIFNPQQEMWRITVSWVVNGPVADRDGRGGRDQLL